MIASANHETNILSLIYGSTSLNSILTRCPLQILNYSILVPHEYCAVCYYQWKCFISVWKIKYAKPIFTATFIPWQMFSCNAIHHLHNFKAVHNTISPRFTHILSNNWIFTGFVNAQEIDLSHRFRISWLIANILHVSGGPFDSHFLGISHTIWLKARIFRFWIKSNSIYAGKD